MHVLVYFVEDDDGPLGDELVRLREDRRRRNLALADRLAELGIPVTYDEVVAEAGGEAGVGRPHFAAALVASGAADSIDDAFDRCLANGRPAYVPKARLTGGRGGRPGRGSAAWPCWPIPTASASTAPTWPGWSPSWPRPASPASRPSTAATRPDSASELGNLARRTAWWPPAAPTTTALSSPTSRSAPARATSGPRRGARATGGPPSRLTWPPAAPVERLAQSVTGASSSSSDGQPAPPGAR